MSSKRILITGMSGLIGGAVRKRLEGSYDLRALNRRRVPGVESFSADISDLEAIRPAFEGVDQVVHLAAIVQVAGGWENILQYNIEGTYNVFEAARQAGVKRVIFASSGSTISNWERTAPYDAVVEGRHPGTWEPLDHESPVRPTELYGCSKVWGEALARHFSDAYGMSMICIRIGHVSESDRPESDRDFSVWCSQRDISQMIQRCIDAPSDLDFEIFYAVSNNKWSYRDIEHARATIGYVPADSADDHRNESS
ncbi:MAG: NAD(P)-dependent oxidoreductase [Candidatus Latescibacteria bacterium]|nr:NAD(P)-dependent oxidoreductase [Candidatus Latescibacterota bacterium]